MTQKLALHCFLAYASATVPSSLLGVQGKRSFGKVVFYKQAYSQHTTAEFHLQSVHCTVYVCNKTLRRQHSQGTDSKAQYFTRGQMDPQVKLTVQKQQASSSTYTAELGLHSGISCKTSRQPPMSPSSSENQEWLLLAGVAAGSRSVAASMYTGLLTIIKLSDRSMLQPSDLPARQEAMFCAHAFATVK